MIRKVLAIFVGAVSVFSFSGCASEGGTLESNENGVEIYLQEDSGQRLYKNQNEGFKIACAEDWEIQKDVDGYLVKFNLNTDEGSVWLGIKKEKLDTEGETTKELSDKYTKLLKNGMVKAADVTIAGKKGKWIKVEPIDNSGIVMKNKEGEKVAIDESNLVTSDANEAREDVIFISDDNYAYVFLYHGDNVSLYNSYETRVDSFLGTFQFINE